MTQYNQTEFCLNLSQGNTDSLPTWMKGIGDRLKPLPLKPLSVQLPLFDTLPYVSAKNTSPKAKASQADRHKQTPIQTS